MGLGIALRLVPEGVIGRLGEFGVVIAHDVRHGDADALLLVVQHQDGAAIGAQADFQRAVRVVRVERHALDLFGVVHLHVAIVEEGDVGGVLLGHGFADVAVALMVVDRLGGGCHMDMLAASGVFCGHNSLPEIARVAGRARD